MIRDNTERNTEFEQLAPGLRRYARALVAREAANPQVEADGLVQETLARAIRADHAGRAGNPRLWLYATLTTLNRARVKTSGAPLEPTPAGRKRRSVVEALSDLTLDHREPLLLVVLEGFSYAEAAAALGLSRPVVGARIARARQTLDASLAGRAPRPAAGPVQRPPYLRLVK